MGLRFSGGGCCCGTCFIFEDDFDRESLGDDWGNEDAVWSISSGNMVASSAGRNMLEYDLTGKGTDLYLEFRWTSSSASVTHFIFGYEDDDNYCYMELRRASGFAWRFVRFMQVIEGTTSQISAWPNIDNDSLDVRLCITGDMVRAELGSNTIGDEFYGFEVTLDAPFTGNRVGFELISGNITIQEIAVFQHSPGDTYTPEGGSPTDCPFCIDRCKCSDDAYADDYELVLSGMTGSHACFNGTYILPGGRCHSVLFFTPCDGSKFNGTIAMYIGGRTGVTSANVIDVVMEHTGAGPQPGGFSTWRLTTSGDEDCTAFEDESVTFFGGFGASDSEINASSFLLSSL